MQRALHAGVGQEGLELLRDIPGGVGIEWIGNCFHEEILQVVLIEHLVHIDCAVDGIPGRVPVGIACRGVDGVDGVNRGVS